MGGGARILYGPRVVRQRVAGVATVSDEALREAMRFVAERMKLVIEPTGALAVAAALTGAVAVRGKRVGVVISGGNVDHDKYAEVLTQTRWAA